MKIGELEFSKYSANGWNGWVAKGYEAVFADVDNWLKDKSEIILDTACRIVRKHKIGEDNVYSKLMWAQNDQSIKEHLLHKWLKWAFGRSRAVMILKTTARMIEKGHLCPTPLLAIRKRVASGWHLNLLVTAEVTLPTVENVILTGSDAEADSAVTRAGAELAYLHREGFVHGDFLPRNTCIGNGKFFFLDNDKSKAWSFGAPFFLQRRNLDQFVYNLMMLKGIEQCHMELPEAFFDAYAANAHWTPKRRKYEYTRIMTKAQKRWDTELHPKK